MCDNTRTQEYCVNLKVGFFRPASNSWGVSQQSLRRYVNIWNTYVNIGALQPILISLLQVKCTMGCIAVPHWGNFFLMQTWSAGGASALMEKLVLASLGTWDWNLGGVWCFTSARMQEPRWKHTVRGTFHQHYCLWKCGPRVLSTPLIIIHVVKQIQSNFFPWEFWPPTHLAVSILLISVCIEVYKKRMMVIYWLQSNRKKHKNMSKFVSS